MEFLPSYHHKDVAHPVLNQWSGPLGYEPHATGFTHELNLDEIEIIYTEFHRLVDQVVAKAFICTAPQLNRIKDQNHKLISKLMTLECAITGDMSLHDASRIASLPVRSSAGSMGEHPPTAGPSLVSRSATIKRRRISKTKTQDQLESTVAPASSSTRNQRNNNASPESGCNVHDFENLGENSKLAKKLFHVVSEEARAQVAELSKHLSAATSHPGVEKPHQAHRFSSLSQITSMSRFLQLVVDLGAAIEGSIFGEQTSRIRKRIALAHFYRAYSLAQDNPGVFLAWYDNQHFQKSGILPPKGGSKSIVQHRFAEMIFHHAPERDANTVLGYTPGQNDDIKRRIAKIQMWRKSGRKWAYIIERFGYGILLLLPPSLSDEE
ncbi:unnamed protein product [Clonostachys chloroleuca]|uniref:Uncharacterized protein n=1 Tax=Clonostachys chloroleuca TaxID=1926264 RepID=A0AA35QC76_9HYPO|nr:unnamed protein product [Clonostachys chloroleuca]